MVIVDLGWPSAAACPVVNLVDELTVVQDGQVIDTWRVDARGRNG